MKMSHRRIVFPLFILLLLTLPGCHPAGNPVPVTAVPFAYDDLYQSRLHTPESSALFLFTKARMLGLDGDLAGAAKALEEAVQADDSAAYLRIALAEVYIELNEGEKALRAIEDALIRDPEMLDGLLLMANLLVAKEEHAEAIHYLERAAELDPDNERILLQQSLLYFQVDEMDRAISGMKRVLEISPENLYAHLVLARAYQRTGLQLLAEQTYRQMLVIDPESDLAIAELGQLYLSSQRSEDEEKLYLEQLKLVPDNTRLRHRLVSRYIEQQRFDEALLQLQTILEQDPDESAALRKAGLINFDRENWSEAAAIFARLVQVDPADAEVRYYYGIALEGNERWAEALTAFGQVATDSVVYADALVHRAYNLHKLNLTREAIELLETHRELLAERSEIYDYLSYLYNSLNQASDALAVIEAGLKRYPEDNILLYRKVVLLEQAGKMNLADDAARQLLQINPEHTNALNFLAYSYAVRNINLDLALQMAQKALAVSDEHYIRDTLGWVLFRLGRHAEALAELQKAAAGLPGDPVVFEHLGDVYQALGRSAEALSAFQQAVSQDGTDNQDLLLKIQRLKGER